MEVILLRHGKTAADELIVSSPLSRCHELAELLGQQHHWPIRLQADLQEMDFGLLDGVPFATQDYPWPLLNAFG